MRAGAWGRAPARAAAACLLLAALASLACRTPDPKALLEITDLDAYWVVEPPMSGEQYIASAVRFRLHNRSSEELHSVQAMAVFRRKGEENLTWGSAFDQVVSRKAPLAPGQSMVVTLKSDARYHTQGPVDAMFTHAEFRDVIAEYFLRVGSSGWVSFGKVPVERRIGARGVASSLLDSASPSPAPSPSPSPLR